MYQQQWVHNCSVLYSSKLGGMVRVVRSCTSCKNKKRVITHLGVDHAPSDTKGVVVFRVHAGCTTAIVRKGLAKHMEQRMNNVDVLYIKDDCLRFQVTVTIIERTPHCFSIGNDYRLCNAWVCSKYNYIYTGSKFAAYQTSQWTSSTSGLSLCTLPPAQPLHWLKWGQWFPRCNTHTHTHTHEGLNNTSKSHSYCRSCSMLKFQIAETFWLASFSATLTASSSSTPPENWPNTVARSRRSVRAAPRSFLDQV